MTLPTPNKSVDEQRVRLFNLCLAINFVVFALYSLWLHTTTPNLKPYGIKGECVTSECRLISWKLDSERWLMTVFTVLVWIIYCTVDYHAKWWFGLFMTAFWSVTAYRLCYFDEVLGSANPPMVACALPLSIYAGFTVTGA